MAKSQIEVLINSSTEFSAQEKKEYINILSSSVSREDRKEATKIALDASRSFITISLALLALNGLFFRLFVSDDDNEQKFAFCFLSASAFLLLISMTAGFCATSKAFKVADGRETTAEPTPWGTKRISPHLNIQSWSGALAVLATTAAVILA